MDCSSRTREELRRTDHYSTERPHQGRDNRPPIGEEPPECKEAGVIECRERLGGLLKHYQRAG